MIVVQLSADWQLGKEDQNSYGYLLKFRYNRQHERRDFCTKKKHKNYSKFVSYFQWQDLPGVPPETLGGEVCGPLPKTLTLDHNLWSFLPSIFVTWPNIHYPIKDLSLKSISICLIISSLVQTDVKAIVSMVSLIYCVGYPGCQRFLFSLGATELSAEAAKASREAARKKPTSTTRSDAPRRWRARRPLVSRVCVG